jgi:glycerol-3-phosphate dehydrogenase (NAD(P)+)
MKKPPVKTQLIGAGTIGTALGNILAETGREEILLHSIEPDVVNEINQTHINSKYFPTLRLHPALKATGDDRMLESGEVIFLAIPSVVMMDYLEKISSFLPPGAILINLAKGFGNGDRTIIECLESKFPNPVYTMKGPSFAREIINRLPTGFTLGYTNRDNLEKISDLFTGTNIHLDFSDDIRGVEILSILKNIYAVVLGIVDAQFNSPNLRFLILTKAFKEMRKILQAFGGKSDTLFNYCGYGDFTLTALNDLSRNRTLGLLIGKGFFTEHVSHELVLEGKTAVNIFYRQIAATTKVEDNFPIMAELYKILNSKYDISHFVKTILNFPES